MTGRMLSPMKRVKRFRWKIGAFDIETEGLDARRFLYGACVWNEKKGKKIITKHKVFYSAKKMADFMLSRKFRNYTWWGHNAGSYDMVALFGNYLLDPRFKVIFNKSRFIEAVYREGKNKITFRDSLNIFPVKLECLGEDIAHVKLETPEWLKITKEDEEMIKEKVNSGEWTYNDVIMIWGISYDTVEKIIKGKLKREIDKRSVDYVVRDAEIVLKAITDFSWFLYEKWGVNISTTTASIALRVFLTDYLEEPVKVSNLDGYFRNSYYGGRTEVVDRRGEWIDKVYYYDFNSLYPSVMYEKEYPDPSSLVYVARPNIKYVLEYEGVSEVTVIIPEMKYPPLPYKYKGKLIFPVGRIRGWWNHNELRMALKYDVKIEKIHRTIYTRRTIRPFKKYVEDLYNMRLEYKKQGNKTGNLYTKLLLNSLYGKWAQRVEYRKFGFIDEQPEDAPKGYRWVFEPVGAEDFGEWKLINEKTGEVLTEDARHDVVSWASYATSWARIKLYEKVMEIYRKGYEVYYTDTDSIITNCPDLENSRELGKLKLEKVGKFRAYAPKVYEFVDIDGKYEIKLKGVRNPVLIKNEYIEKRVIKPKEALRRRNVEAGQGEFRVKKLKLKDEKRNWNGSRGSPLKLNVV